MSMTTSAAKVAVTMVNGGLTTEHYASLLEMLEQVLNHSGEAIFKDFMRLALPRVIERWKRGREQEAIMDQDQSRLLHDYELCSGCELIANERYRQIKREGFTEAHDDEHKESELLWAAVCYAAPKDIFRLDPENDPFDPWPWAGDWDKRKKHGVIKRLVIAGALIAAELDRLQRIEAGNLKAAEESA